jgi:hypothetical protein
MPPKPKEKAKILPPDALVSSDPITSTNPTSNMTSRKRSGTFNLSKHEPQQKTVKDKGYNNISIYSTPPVARTSGSVPISSPPPVAPTTTRDIFDPEEEDSEEEENDDEEEDEDMENENDQEEESFSHLEEIVDSIVYKVTKSLKYTILTQNKKIKKLEQKIDILIQSTQLSSKQQTTSKPVQNSTNGTKSSTSQTWNKVATQGLNLQQTASSKAKTIQGQEISKKQRTFTITRNTTSDNKDINSTVLRDTINTALSKAQAPSQLKVSSATLNPRGNIVILTKDNCTAEEVLQFREQIEKAVQKYDQDVKEIRTSEQWARFWYMEFTVNTFLIALKACKS